jgi:hypothetical protein
MQTRTKAIGIAAILAMVALVFAYPVFAAPAVAPASTNIAATSTSARTPILTQPTALTVGQTITFTSTSGAYRVIGEAKENGVASGSLTLTVTGAYRNGYALSLTSGTLDINSTSYTIAAGSAEMGPWQAHLVGQGSFGASTPGSFIMSGAAHADFFGATFNTLRFDVQVNGVEYGVVLVVTAT